MRKKVKGSRINLILKYLAIPLILSFPAYNELKHLTNTTSFKDLINLHEARQFEKKLARAIYNRDFLGEYNNDNSSHLTKLLYKQIIYGENGLVESNKIKGIQPLEYKIAFMKIHGVDIDFSFKDLNDPRRKRILDNFHYYTPEVVYEHAFKNWGKSSNLDLESFRRYFENKDKKVEEVKIFWLI